MIIIMVTSGLSDAAETITKEYKLKAAFIYNFAKFVEWPASSFSNARSPIVIGILGRNPFGGELSNIVRGRRIHGRVIEIRNIRTDVEARGTQILFVSGGEENNFSALKNALGAGVLTVGESALFANQGGIINFHLEGDKLRFEIDVAVANRSGLKVSAQLQKLASSIHR